MINRGKKRYSGTRNNHFRSNSGNQTSNSNKSVKCVQKRKKKNGVNKNARTKSASEKRKSASEKRKSEGLENKLGEKKMKVTTPEALRGLRDLIRTKYELDVEIWNLRGARRMDRPVVEKKMQGADAVLTEIIARSRLGSRTTIPGLRRNGSWPERLRERFWRMGRGGG